MSAVREQALLERICRACSGILGEKLSGVYLHGSLAFGCFTWETGDIDFLAVVDSPLTQPEKEALIRILLDMDASAPPKGFEMSVVLRSVCKPFQYPTPFELHFSNAHKRRAEADISAYCREMHGTDADLAAHITVLRSAGRTLLGQPIESVFGEVPRSAYVDSILCDVEGAEAEVGENLVYVILNLCRVLAYLTEGAVLSKAQGGEWGLTHLPAEEHPLLTAALTAYDGAVFPDLPGMPAFAREMLRRIRSLI